MLCETRWSAKYKSIRFFAENFTEIHRQLKHVAQHDSNANGWQNAHNLRTASKTPVFIVTLHVIAQYSSILEPVTQALQSVHVDMLCVKQHVHKLLLLFDNHRKNAEKYFAEGIYAPSLTTAEEIGVTVSLPRQCDRQVHRANIGGTTEEYYRRSIYVPYMDSLIQSLKSRFSETNTPAFTVYKLHPAQLEKANRSEYKALVQTIQQFYSFDNFEQEAMSWYDMQKQGLLSQSENLELDFIDLVRHIELYPAVRQAFITLLTLPATTCTVERSFSTLRRVKTWLRTTMSDDRLSGLCWMSVHRSRINSDKKSLTNLVKTTETSLFVQELINYLIRFYCIFHAICYVLLNTIVLQNWQRESADSPPTPIMSYYSFLNVSLHFKICVIFPGGSTDPPCPYVVTPMVPR